MKHSEMIELLDKAFGTPDGQITAYAEDILTLLEEQGMLPPYSPPVGTGDFEECGCSVINDCRWEDE